MPKNLSKIARVHIASSSSRIPRALSAKTGKESSESSDNVKLAKFKKPEDFYNWHEQAKAYAIANGYAKYLKRNPMAATLTDFTATVVFEPHEEDYDITEVQGGELSVVPAANAEGHRFDSDGLCWDDNEIRKALAKYRNRVKKEEAELKAFGVILKATIGNDYKNQFKEIINPNAVVAHILRIAQGGDVAAAITRYTGNLQTPMKPGHNMARHITKFESNLSALHTLRAHLTDADIVSKFCLLIAEVTTSPLSEWHHHANMVKYAANLSNNSPGTRDMFQKEHADRMSARGEVKPKKQIPKALSVQNGNSWANNNGNNKKNVEEVVGSSMHELWFQRPPVEQSLMSGIQKVCGISRQAPKRLSGQCTRRRFRVHS